MQSHREGNGDEVVICRLLEERRVDDGGALGERLADVNVCAARAAPALGMMFCWLPADSWRIPMSFVQIGFSCLGIPER